MEKTDGTLILDGIAEVEAPLTTIVLKDQSLPMLLVDQHDHFGVLVERCRRLPPMPTAVVCPDDANSLGGALLSRREGLIAPVFVGSAIGSCTPPKRPAHDISGIAVIDIADHSEAAARAIAMVHSRRTSAL